MFLTGIKLLQNYENPLSARVTFAYSKTEILIENTVYKISESELCLTRANNYDLDGSYFDRLQSPLISPLTGHIRADFL